MQKNYDHLASEDPIYAAWEAAGVLEADENSDKKSYTIPLPPPNVTGQLHLGHAAMLAVEDILIRHKKMTGHEVLWLPGTDHAAIATENVVLKHLGLKSREDMSRADFLSECRKFASEKHDRIVHQIKKMGAHLDWSREAYTFDRERNFAVNWIFKKLYDDGLITRGHRMINWSVGAQSVLADDEVEWQENNEDFFEFWCGPFLLGTVRAETKCADSPVMVHPKAKYVRARSADGRECIVTEKYFTEHTQLRKDFEIQETVPGKKLEGMKFEAETYAGKRKFWVVADEVIDPAFGTGAMTISTAHSPDDFVLAQKYDFDLVQKIDFKGKMTQIAGPCEGLPVLEARKRAGEIMEEKGLLFQRRPYANRVPKCYRSDTVVEPMLSPQWFISVEKEFPDPVSGKKTTLKKLMQEAVRGGHVQIVPKRFEKVYFQWIDNLRDWCISRQIWWGHRIPVWYDADENVHLPEVKSITFARHGESEANVKNVIGGDFSLTEKGKKTAEQIFKAVKDQNISKIICSDLKRSKETAAIVSELFANDVQIEEWPELNEFSSSELAQKAGKNFRREGPLQINFDQLTDESLDQIRDRAQSVFATLQEEAGEVLVIGHQNITAALFHFSRSDDTEGFVRFRKNWNWGRGECKDLEFLQSPRGKNLRQDEDTLDTWFSSALWPFSTLGWPNQTRDFEKFYPTDVLETGHDILFFWVARMIMFGRYATGEYPFHTVYLHGMVTDEQGRKMSKSRPETCIDPLETIEEVGADAVRLSLVIGATPGNPIPLSKEKIAGYRNFVNKLWNAGRFVQMQTSQNPPQSPLEKGGGTASPQPTSLADRWIASRLTTVAKDVATKLQKYQISAAGDAIYHFVWDEFCDWYIEASKINSNPAFLRHLFLEILKLAHPLVPFITEKLWKELGAEGVLIEQAFPEPTFQDAESVDEFAHIREVVTEIRRVRAEKKLNPREKISVQISPKLEAESAALIESLAGVKFEKITAADATKLSVGKTEILLHLPVDATRIEKEKKELASQIAALKSRLANPGYTEKAPKNLVDQTRKELAEAEEKLKKLGGKAFEEKKDETWLVQEISEKAKISSSDAKKALQEFEQFIIRAYSEKKRVKISGLGEFDFEEKRKKMEFFMAEEELS